jgi:hypothetical protein
MYIAVASKLLVPIGYMPAAIAGGSPFMLCVSYLGGPSSQVAAAEVPSSEHAAAEQESAKWASMGSGAMGHHSGHAAGGHHANVSGDVKSDDNDIEDGDHDSGQHHEWERCSFGGLATSTPITSGFHHEWMPQVSTRAYLAERIALGRSSFVAFRSRAPPLSHS